ncbi:MFS transporter [Oscillospiraceae bacterium LTW-04]|nr:MFS transporter [Oscillospiraceae bacterium MB24-C1]
MNNERRARRKIILTGALITGTGIGVFSNCTGVFVTPVCSALGFSRGGFTLIGTISILSSMMVLLLFGRLLQIVPIRRVLMVCAIVCASVPLAYSFCDKLWQFYLCAFVNGLAVNGMTMMTVGVLIEKNLSADRGMATGASFAGVGIFSSIMIPLLQLTIQYYGWRWGYRLQSAVGFAVLLPTVSFLVQDKGGLSDRKKEEVRGVCCEKAIKTTGFWLLFAGLFCANFVNLSLYNHAIPYLTDIGFSAMAAAMISSAATLMMSVSKPAYGVALDKFGLKVGALSLGMVLLAGSLMALALVQYHQFGFLYSVLLAGCACANAIPGNVFAATLFGRKDYARIVSRLTLAASAGAASGVPLAGFLFDRTGSYHNMWLLCAVLSLMAGWFLFAAVGKTPGIKDKEDH